MMGLAADTSEPAAGSFMVPPGQRQPRIRFSPEPSPLKRWDTAADYHIASITSTSAFSPSCRGYGVTRLEADWPAIGTCEA